MELLETIATMNPLALFLDVDGTLLEIAATPTAVNVPGALRDTLVRAVERARGAVALISGRSLADLDRLFAPHVFPAAGQHGMERRNASGSLSRPMLNLRLLKPVRQALTELQTNYPGLVFEDKGASLAIHYRQVPQYESLVKDVMTQLLAPLQNELRLVCGKCVFELTFRRYSKRTAIEAFMSESPFAGRTPAFIGDDVTDEEGFLAVNALGGYSIRVGAAQTTHARYRFENVTEVLGWLHAANSHVERTHERSHTI